MARKAKKRMHRMPPLSYIDKLIYGMIMLILCAAYLVLMFGTFYLRKEIAFADQSVIAKGDHASLMWLFVPWFTFFVITFGLWVNACQDRKPIFGRRNFKYGPPAWPKVYPLFMKNKPYVWVSENTKQYRKFTAWLLTGILLVSFIPYPWSLYGRDCLRSDGGIEQYNMFNIKSEDFSPEEISSVKLEVYRHRSGKYVKTRHWGVRVVLTTDTGDVYTFKHSEFRREQTTPRYWLSEMLQLRSVYSPEIIAYSNVSELDRLISDQNLTAEETRMVYQLFGRT